jgi:cytochrome c biogenesis factor
LDGSPRPGVVTINAFLNPLVNLLWLSAVVLVLGFAIAIWPDPRLAVRLARRTSDALVRAP